MPANLGSFYLKVGGTLYETTKYDGVDLSTDRLGRPDVVGVTDVKLQFNMTGMGSWNTGDVLMAFAPNIGFYQNLAFTAGGPTNGSTTLTGTAPWNGYKIDSSKADAVQVVQLSAHTTTGGNAYVSLDRAYDVPAFTMINTGTQTVGGAFTQPTQKSISLDIDVTSFNQHAATANPGVTLKTIAGSAYAAAAPEVIPSPSLISFAKDSSAGGSLTSARWRTAIRSRRRGSATSRSPKAFSVPYAWNNVTGTLTRR